MKPLQCIFLCLFFLLSCRSVPEGYQRLNSQFEFNIGECSDLMKQINKRWYKKNERPCYYQDIPLLQSIKKNENCFIGLSKKNVIEILGAPSKEKNENKIYYSSSLICEEEDVFFGHWSLGFVLKEMKVVEVTLSGNPPAH